VRENPSTTEERVAFWKKKLGAGAGRVLVFLVNSYPAGFSRDQIVEGANVTARSLKDYLSLLRRAKLIIENGGQTCAAESIFFD
jgi:DNA-binding winged helix-turn-helix (wHTH) protein